MSEQSSSVGTAVLENEPSSSSGSKSVVRPPRTATHPAARGAAPKGPPTDPVSIAFSLGWHVEELYHFESLNCGSESLDRVKDWPPESLPGVGSLTSNDRATLLANQIQNEIPKVWAGTTPAAPDLARVHDLIGTSADQSTATRRALEWAIYDLHKALLVGLTAQDFQIGKGYALGRKLAETFLLCDPMKPESYHAQFGPERITRIQSWLSDLKSSFPPHSATATLSGLSVWADWINPTPGQPPEVRRTGLGLARRSRADRAGRWDGDATRIAVDVNRQGNIWRSLLSGEKVATDLLTAADYLGAVKLMVDNVTHLAWTFLRGWLGIALAVLTIITVAIAGLVVWRSNNWQQSFTAIVAALGALGLTAGSLGATLRKALLNAEKPLWDAEVANAICHASLITPQESRSRQPAGEQAAAAPPAQADQPAALPIS